jgi:two-component system cell cycle sensor histidine kinase/response regulator CckA
VAEDESDFRAAPVPAEGPSGRLRDLEQALKRERALFNGGPVVVFRWRAEAGWPVEFVSENIRQFGYTPDDFTSGRVPYATVVHPDDLERIAHEVAGHSAQGSVTFEQDYRIRSRDGQYRDLYDYTVIERDAAGKVTHYAGYVLDMTERRQLEAELRHSQRLDSLGRLAGGVAHDFNNLLTAILGSADYGLRLVEADSPLAEHLESIRLAGRRAAELTRQLQSFASKQPGSPQAVEVSGAVRELIGILRRLLGENILLETRFPGEEVFVRIDPGQLQQVLVNLAVNARDAMPSGGVLTVDVSLVADPALPQTTQPPLMSSERSSDPGGAWVLVRIADTGVGMDSTTLSRLFEPFYTTKEPGRGTGLGLAVCLGIVQQAGGRITAASEPGQGSTFSVLLPRSAAHAPTASDARHPVPPSGPAVVLLVEDEALVRDFAARALTEGGYTVMVADSGEAALQMARQGVTIDVVVTDVVMPSLGGPELVRRLRERRAELPVVFMSGYPGRAAGPLQPVGRHERLVQKPFSAQELLHAVAAVRVAKNS